MKKSSSSSSSSNKETYVYIRDESSSSGSACWIPAVQIESPKNGIATVKVPIYNTDTDLLSCTETATAKSSSNGRSSMKGKASSAIQYERDYRKIELRNYENKVLPMQNVSSTTGQLENYNDMVELPFMHEAAILYNLKIRHLSQLPYTRTGDIIFAVNPYQWYTNTLYTVDKQRYYANRLVYDTSSSSSPSNTSSKNGNNNSNNADPRSTMEPHIYEVSALAYKGIQETSEYMAMDTRATGTNQSILVSGESGAGKTETVKLCLHHIAAMQGGDDSGLLSSSSFGDSPGTIINPVVRRILESNPLLEAFGNAQTRRNDNSSRFGKYIQLQFEKTSSNNNHCSTLVGSVCNVYLLEKSRIVQPHVNSSSSTSNPNQPSKERNFHIFYQLLASPTKTKYWDGLQNTSYETFKYIGIPSTTTIEGISDDERFLQTIQALQLVNITDTKLNDLIQCMCIVLLLGNVGFEPVTAGNDDQSKINSSKEIKALAELLGISNDKLTNCLTTRTFATTKESHTVPLSVAQAKDSCDALAKEIYERAFLWLVNAINVATSAAAGGSYKTIGLLDIFGFESFPQNGFEQLCINYANEKLQQKFNYDIFATVKEEYENEGIGLDDIYYDDNTDVLDLIEGKTGLLALLNEECVRPKGNDYDFVQKALQINCTKSDCLHINKTNRMSFAIHHYAGIVMYTATNFVTKNLDTIPTDLQDCMDQSRNLMVRTKKEDLVTVDENNSNGNSTSSARSSMSASSTANRRQKSNINAPTIWTKYKTQLSTLMRNLQSTQSRYIRCIKPNNMKKPLLMEHEPVIDQLRCAGVVAAITISRSCFPNRLPNSVVLARYSSKDTVGKSSKRQGQSSAEIQSKECKDLMDYLLKDKETKENGKVLKAFVVGKTKTYFRAGALEYLESNRCRAHDVYISIIQRAARRWLQRNSGKNNARRRRQLEEEKAAKERRAREEQAAKQKAIDEQRAAHEKKQASLKEQIKQLEKALQEEEQSGNSKLTSLENRCYATDAAINCLDSTRQLELEEQCKEIQAKKAQQEKKLEQANKLIAMLKKENTKLRAKQEKALSKLHAVEETSNKVHGNVSTLSERRESIGRSVTDKESKHTVVKDEHDIVYKQNCDIKKQINHVSDMYTNVATSRLEYQKGMVKLLHLVEDDVKKRALQKEIVTIAFAAEDAAKQLMSELEIETSGASLDHYSNHGF